MEEERGGAPPLLPPSITANALPTAAHSSNAMPSLTLTHSVYSPLHRFSLSRASSSTMGNPSSSTGEALATPSACSPLNRSHTRDRERVEERSGSSMARSKACITQMAPTCTLTKEGLSGCSL